MPNKKLKIPGQLGLSGGRKVFVGFAASELLSAISKADVLDESTGLGYQRPINEKHSLDFRQYIQDAAATTIPLTFNLRPRKDGAWKVTSSKYRDFLEIDSTISNVLYQVDCQHRLGFLSDVSVQLPFMAYIGLSQKEEMTVFNVINSKAKGLNSSLLDFHETKLVRDIENLKPELVVSVRLTEDANSPWYRQLNLGGRQTAGVKRRASLRTMQKSVKRFLRESKILEKEDLDSAYQIIRCFWQCIANLLADEWENPRKHMINKGIGVYSLMSIASDLYLESHNAEAIGWQRYFAGRLSDFITKIDWSSSGPMKGLGGESGVAEAVEMLRQVKCSSNLKVVKNG